MDIKRLRYVLAARDFGSIKAASEQLNIGQSALTKSIAELERELGYELFERHSRGVQPTRSGEHFMARAAVVVGAMERFRHEVHSAYRENQHLVRVVVSPPSLEELMCPAVSACLQRHPETQVHLHTATEEQGILLLKGGKTDILVNTTHDYSGHEGIVVKPLKPVKLRLFVRHGHPLLQDARATPEMFWHYLLIVPDQTGLDAGVLEPFTNPALSSPLRGVSVLENFITVVTCVRNTDAVGVVTEAYARNPSFRAQFQSLDEPALQPSHHFYAHDGRWPATRAMAAFMACLEENQPADATGLAEFSV